MVSKIVRENIVNLQRIAQSKPKTAKLILKHASSGLIESIRQVILNTLNGVLQLKPNQLAALKKYRARLRKIRDSKTPSSKRKIIIQEGHGFIIPLLTAVLPHIVGGIASLISKRKNK